jgi:hypothetical protein
MCSLKRHLYHLEVRDTPLECHRQAVMDGYVWSIDIPRASTSEPNKGGLVNEHGSFILEEPLDPCSPEKPPESIHCAKSTYESYSYPMPIDHNNIKKMVVDAFVYHKYCKSRSYFWHKCSS